MNTNQLHQIIQKGIANANITAIHDGDTYRFSTLNGGYAEIKIITLVDHLFVTYAATRFGEANNYGLRNAERLEPDDIRHIALTLIS